MEGSPRGGGPHGSTETRGPASMEWVRFGLLPAKPEDRGREGGGEWLPKVTGNRGSRSETPP